MGGRGLYAWLYGGCRYGGWVYNRMMDHLSGECGRLLASWLENFRL